MCFILDFRSPSKRAYLRKILFRFYFYTIFFALQKNLALAIFGRGNFYAKLVWHKNCLRGKIDFDTNLADCELVKFLCIVANGALRGCPPLERVVSNEVRTRGRLPPPKNPTTYFRKFTISFSSSFESFEIHVSPACKVPARFRF